MKSILIISNTYYQLITAIRLKETFWSNDKVDIVISDQSNNSEGVAESLNKLYVFENVLWIKTKKICQNNKSIYLRIKRWKYVFCGINYPGLTNKKYDELVYYNPDVFIYGIFSKLIKNNDCMMCSRYEEGVLSYIDSEYLKNSRLKNANIIRKHFHKKILETYTMKFYCFYPQLYLGKLNALPIPQIDNHTGMGAILRKIFNIETEMLKIHEKYIFFTGVFDFEGGGAIGEFELVMNVAQLVGKDNLIVKTHPRDKRTVYEESGITVYKNSSIPWEAIQLNYNFTDKIFLTVNSGSVLGVNMMLENKVKTYFLYNCCNIEKNQEAVAYIKLVKQFMLTSNIISDKLKIVENMEGLKEICDS